MTDDVAGESPKDVLLPEDNLDSRSITWPTVLGAISVVYSVLGVFSNTCGTASIFLGDAGLKLAGVEVEGGLDLPAWITISTIVSGGVGLILAILVFLGIRLFMCCLLLLLLLFLLFLLFTNIAKSCNHLFKFSGNRIVDTKRFAYTHQGATRSLRCCSNCGLST